MITTKIQVAGTQFDDYQRCTVSRSMDMYNSSSNFSVRYDSPFGRHSDDFSVGQTIDIFAEDDNDPTKLFTGVIERVQFTGRGTTQVVTLKGRDFSLRLQDATVDPVIFTETEISSIVTSIIGANVDDITTTNVDNTGVTLKRIVFNHTNVFNALKQLAKLSGFYFFVDNNKDLHFQKRNNVDSGIVLDNTLVNKSTLNQTREGMVNDVTVYGDRAFAGFQEDFIADGTGSVFNLSSKPRNTLVTISGGTPVPQIGGVLELTNKLVSGTDAAEYLVSFNDKKIVFISGTEIGYSKIPTNGQIVQIKYDRDIPIVKAGTDRESITLFGRKEKIINDKSINDPNTATAILQSELANSSPFRGFEAGIKGWFDITPGNTARVTLSDFNIDEDISILNATYTFDKNSVQDEKVIKIRLDRKIKDITDDITSIRERVNAIEEADRQETDLITRLEQSSNQFSVVGSRWIIQTNSVVGSVSHLYSTGFIPFLNPFNLGSAAGQGNLAGSFTGSAVDFTAFSAVQSGGFYV